MSNKVIDQAKLNEFMSNSWSWHGGGGGSDDRVYILEDESGAQYSAYLSDEGVDLTATANDIRIGTVALNDDGVVEGTKEIPSYYTVEGFKLVTDGSEFVLYLSDGMNEYTKFQAIICSFNTSMTNSVSAEKVVINGSVYPVQSTSSESELTVEGDTIKFGITNSSGAPCLIRYFTYKEVY